MCRVRPAWFMELVVAGYPPPPPFFPSSDVDPRMGVGFGMGLLLGAAGVMHGAFNWHGGA